MWGPMVALKTEGQHVGGPGTPAEGFELPNASSEGQPHLFPAYNLNETSKALASGPGAHCL